MSDADPALVDWVLGGRSPQQLESHLRRCRECALACEALCEWIVAATASEAQALPSRSLRERVLAVAAPSFVLADQVESLAGFFDLTVFKARALLAATELDGAWEPGPLPGMGLIHLCGGPRVAAADAGLLKFPAAAHWPLHRHVGGEQMLILSGAICEDGMLWSAGDILDRPAGSQHSFVVTPEEDCVCAVLVHGGLELPPGTPLGADGFPLTPTDSR